MSRPLFEQELTHSVIGAFYEVYNHLGFGFLEHLYVLAMQHELSARGHAVAREVRVPVMYKGTELGIQRLDMVVDEKLVVEIKSMPHLPRNAGRQVYNYLRASELEVGILLHFGREARFSVQVCRAGTKGLIARASHREQGHGAVPPAPQC